MEHTALILGANSDIAIALAHVLARNNYDLILAGRNVQLLSTLASDLKIRYGNGTSYREFDALKTDSHRDFYQFLKPGPDLVVCAFGYLGDQDQAIDDWGECNRIILTNFLGTVSILNIISRDFKKRREGCIIGISSVAGDRGRQSNYIYGSSKAGFTAYLSGLRNDLYHHGVHVLTVRPGFVRTKMIDGIETPGPLTASAEQVASGIFRAIKTKKNNIYILGIWRWVMWIIRNIPESIFKRLKL